MDIMYCVAINLKLKLMCICQVKYQKPENMVQIVVSVLISPITITIHVWEQGDPSGVLTCDSGDHVPNLAGGHDPLVTASTLTETRRIFPFLCTTTVSLAFSRVILFICIYSTLCVSNLSDMTCNKYNEAVEALTPSSGISVPAASTPSIAEVQIDPALLYVDCLPARKPDGTPVSESVYKAHL